jgi:hypothetical protein
MAVSLDPRALSRANEVKRIRYALKQEVSALSGPAGRERVAALLIDPPDGMEGARIGDVLSWIRLWGDYRVTRFLARAGISGEKAIAVTPARYGYDLALTPRQRALIAERLRAI